MPRGQSGRAERPVLTPDAARRVFLLLSFTRWFPVGLVVGLMVLWKLERGLTVSEATTAGAVGGPGVLVVAYAVTSVMHGCAGPMHSALVHREARADNRATVLSLDSMAGFAGFALAAPLLGWVAEQAGTQTAMVVGGLVGALGVICYLPAGRAHRRRGRTGQSVMDRLPATDGAGAAADPPR